MAVFHSPVCPVRILAGARAVQLNLAGVRNPFRSQLIPLCLLFAAGA